jgi:hypothetical protein
MLNYTDEELEPLLINFIQVGIDLYHMRLAGTSWGGDGGHSNGRKFPIIFAGIMLDNEHMKNVDWPDSWGEDSFTYYGTPLGDYSKGKPLWGLNCTSSYQPPECSYSGDAKECRDADGELDACPGYMGMSSPNWVGEALASIIIKDASGKTGKEIWNHDAFFDYVDRWMAKDVNHPYAGSSVFEPFIDDVWDIYRSQYGCIYQSLNTQTHTRIYNCSNQLFDCSAVTQCSDYSVNDRACSYDPCNLDCNGNCQSSGMCQLTSAYWDIT